MSHPDYWEVSHADHGLMNPFSADRLLELGEVLRLAPGVRVLDLACGKGAALLLWAERFGIAGTGVDKAGWAVEAARAAAAGRGLSGRLQFVCQDARDYPLAGAGAGVVMCLGASFIWDGFGPTLRALRSAGRPDASWVVGEPYWVEEDPPEAFLRQEGLSRETFGTLAEVGAWARAEGFEVTYFAGSTAAEWDRYETLQWWAVHRFYLENPGDEVARGYWERARRERDWYFRWRRRHLGWGIFVLRPQH